MKYALMFVALVPVIAIATYAVTIVTMNTMYNVSHYSDTGVTVLVFASIIASATATVAYRIGRRDNRQYDKEIIKRLYRYV